MECVRWFMTCCKEIPNIKINCVSNCFGNMYTYTVQKCVSFRRRRSFQFNTSSDFNRGITV